jgi:gamma-glutamyl-gamma-aminobutyrate hydrolase PuuD
VAWSPDGTVEGIEDPGERFVLGVQWHAETLDRGPVHPRLFEALVAAAAGARLDLAA